MSCEKTNAGNGLDRREGDRIALCEARETVASGREGDYSFSLPESIGEGFMKTIAVQAGICVSEYRYRFKRGVRGSGYSDPDAIDLHFCLQQGVEWESGESGSATLALSTDQAIMSAGTGSEETICYGEGSTYEFVSIKMSRAAFDQTVLSLLDDDGRHSVDCMIAARCKTTLSPATKLALHQLVNCPLDPSLARIYSGGKLLELLAIFLAEAALGGMRTHEGLQRTDREAVEQAKVVLDARLTNPPTYSELARMLYVSETKLSRGFKMLYGKPMHAYVIERRLEHARLLLEGEGVSVAEAATTVGYGNLGHFSSAFKRRYGVSPSSVSRTAPTAVCMKSDCF